MNSSEVEEPEHTAAKSNEIVSPLLSSADFRCVFGTSRGGGATQEFSVDKGFGDHAYVHERWGFGRRCRARAGGSAVWLTVNIC